MRQWVGRGNLHQISYIESCDRTAFALQAHAAPSGECNCMDVCIFTFYAVLLTHVKSSTVAWVRSLSDGVHGNMSGLMSNTRENL